MLQGGSRCHPSGLILAKVSLGATLLNKIGKPSTVPCKVTGHRGSVLVCLILAPRVTGVVSAPVSKKQLLMAGISGCHL